MRPHSSSLSPIKKWYKISPPKTAGLPKEPVDNNGELKDKTADILLLALGEGLLGETGGSERYGMLYEFDAITTTKKSGKHDSRKEKLG